MAKTTLGAHGPSEVHLSYQAIRNLTAPEEKHSGVATYFANLPAYELDKLHTRDNLRDYIAEHNDRKRNNVHRAIHGTMESEPDRFINRNGGVTISCSSVEVHEDKKTVTLRNASLINGAQTQGEIRRYMAEVTDPNTGELPSEVPFHVRAEINVDPDYSSVIETAIARNTTTDVKSISQAGARGILDDLATSIAKNRNNAKIRKSETDQGVMETLQILQYARLLMPSSVSGTSAPSEKLRAYKNKAQCLADFSNWHATKEADADAKQKYEFTVQIAPAAVTEYEFWESHIGWNGHQIWAETKKGGRAVRRDKSDNIVWVSPGILFPLLSAMSEFVTEDPNNGWQIVKPDLFSPDEMIKKTVAQFRAHDSNPMDMGRSESAYDALRIYPETLVQVIEQSAAAAE